MPPGEPSPTGPANPQKARRGLSRLWHATGYSLQGLRAGWGESAFRQEALAALVLLPASLWLGANWVETAVLAGAVLLVQFATRLAPPWLLAAIAIALAAFAGGLTSRERNADPSF